MSPRRPDAPRIRHVSDGAVRAGRHRGRALLPDLRRPRRRAAAARDGPRRTDDVVGPGLLRPCSPRPASTSSATTTATPAARPGSAPASPATSWCGRSPAGGSGAPYTMSDLAGDAVGLLDHLGLDSAHVVGVSMGGMIAQTMAVEHPARVRSLTSIMSTTGRRTVGWQHPSLLPRLIAPRKAGREAYVESSVVMWSLIGSAGLPVRPRRAPHPRRGHLRPRRQRQRCAAPDAGDPDPARPHPAPAQPARARPW